MCIRDRLTSEALTVGQRVSFTGKVGRIDGEYQISCVTFEEISSGTVLSPLGVTTKAIGNDPTETLNYIGINTTGLLVRICGKVDAKISIDNVIYVDDGGNYQDGVGPFHGIRVRCPEGVALPSKGQRVVITGISRVHLHVLTEWGEVNGDWYPPGTAVYVPSIWVRDSADILLL